MKIVVGKNYMEAQVGFHFCFLRSAICGINSLLISRKKRLGVGMSHSPADIYFLSDELGLIGDVTIALKVAPKVAIFFANTSYCDN